MIRAAVLVVSKDSGWAPDLLLEMTVTDFIGWAEAAEEVAKAEAKK